MITYSRTFQLYILRICTNCS